MSPQIHIYLEPQNETLFGNKVLADVTKMKSYRIRVGSKSSDWCPQRKKKGRADTQSRTCDDRGRDRNGAATSLGRQGLLTTNSGSAAKTRGEEQSLPQSLREELILTIPWFWTSSLQNHERKHFHVVTAAPGNEYRKQRYRWLNVDQALYLWGCTTLMKGMIVPSARVGKTETQRD